MEPLPAPAPVGPSKIGTCGSIVKRRAMFACAKWLETHIDDVKLQQQMCKGGAVALLWHLLAARDAGAVAHCCCLWDATWR